MGKSLFLLRAYFEFFESFIDTMAEKEELLEWEKEKNHPFYNFIQLGNIVKEKIRENVKEIEDMIHALNNIHLNEEYKKFHTENLKGKFHFRTGTLRSSHSSMELKSLKNKLDKKILLENLENNGNIKKTIELQPGETKFWFFGKHLPLRINIPNEQYFAIFDAGNSIVHVSNFENYGQYRKNEYKWKDDINLSLYDYSVKIISESDRIYFELDEYNTFVSNNFEFKFAGLKL